MGNSQLADTEDTGRSCPYCRFALKEGVDVTRCTGCGAPHHADCWTENGGCAVVGCAAGPAVPDAPKAGGAPLPAVAAAGKTVVGKGGQPMVLQPAPQQGGSKALTYAVVLLAVAVAGLGVALFINNENSKVAVVSSSTDGSNAPGANVSNTTPAELVPGPAMKSAILEVLRQHHTYIANGDYQSAWDLLSERKKTQYRREYGYATWQNNQESLSPYLGPSGMTVSVEDFDPRTKVARVDIEGMTWSGSGGCAYWNGITWVKWENGAWKYDPGYSTTPQRRATWKPRVTELLGGQCGTG